MNEYLLEVQGLCKKYKGFELKDISFRLEAGYILGLVGRNGAGKTTLMKLIQHIITPSAGKVLLAGNDMAKSVIESKNQIGFIMENPFFDAKTLGENMELFGRFYKKYNGEKCKAYVERFHLDIAQLYGKLSKGMQTKFQLAFALSHEAKLLIMDEPTGGLDPIFRREFLTLLQEVAETENVSIIISTHITNDLDKIADFIALIDDGELMFYKDKEELFDEFWLVKGGRDQLKRLPEGSMIAVRKYNQGFEGLTDKKGQCEMFNDDGGLVFERASIEDIMYYINKGRSEVI